MRNKAWALGLLIIALIVGGYSYLRCLRVEVHRKRPLCKCEAESRFTLLWPEGKAHCLVLEAPIQYSSELKTVPFTFHGLVSIIKEKASLASLRISSESVKACNWLVPQTGHLAFILTWDPSVTTMLDTQLSAGEKYEFNISFDAAPSQGAAVWLTWIQDSPLLGRASFTSRSGELQVTTMPSRK